MRRSFVPPLIVAVVLALTAAAPAHAAGGGGASAPEAPLPPMKVSGGAKAQTLDSVKRENAPTPTRKKAVKIERKAKRIAHRSKKRRRLRKVRRAPRPAATPQAPLLTHTFPLIGAFTYGEGGSRFGAGRKGHTHQGQDLAAAEGTPVVAPASGIVKVVRYQATGAGYYVVLDGDGEDRDYVFMHLRKGSTIVKVGDQVVTGQRLADVGNTGRSYGAHLHFEIWTDGGWYTGGKPIDPLPLLRAWDAFS